LRRARQIDLAPLFLGRLQALLGVHEREITRAGPACDRADARACARPLGPCCARRGCVRKFTSMLEIHGKQECPFAWRVRLAAREKGIAFEWIPHDVGSPDPRASQHNPQQRSPLLWDEGFPLVESLVIAQYIDESREGRALLPGRAKERARMRELTATVAAKSEIPPRHARDANAARRRISEGHA